MKLFLGTALAAVLATSAFAQEAAEPVQTSGVTGFIEMEFAETPAGDIGATTTLGLGIEASGVAFGRINLEGGTDGALAVDEWEMGTVVGPATVSIGDRGGVFVESVTDDHGTLGDPAIGESLQASVGTASVAVGFTDLAQNALDVSNVQGAYTLNMSALDLTAAGDYNFDSEDWMVGGRVSGIDVVGVGLGSTLTYGSANETFGYEVDGTIMGVTAYLNGDDTDMLQNIGASVSRNLGGLTLGTDINYNIDTEELSPSATLAFKF